MSLFNRHSGKIWIAATVIVVLSFLRPIPLLNYLLLALYVALTIKWLSCVFSRPGGLLGGSEFLCDSCKLDYDGACRHSERPNATKCPDHEPRNV